MNSRYQTVEEYLAGVSEEKRVALENLRETIRSIVPEAEECISYQIPAFRLHGMLVGFGATANHCAFYLMSTATMDAYKNQLKGYATGKGTIRFQADHPLPPNLVRTLVEARLAENLLKRKKP